MSGLRYSGEQIVGLSLNAFISDNIKKAVLSLRKSRGDFYFCGGTSDYRQRSYDRHFIVEKFAEKLSNLGTEPAH